MRPNRRHLPVLLGGLLVSILGIWSCRPAEPPRTVVLVAIDTLRADHLPSYDYPRFITPFLSALAENGTLFEIATSSCSHKAPSHASIFTGLHPPQHRLLENGQPIAPDYTDKLKALGYL